MADTALRGPFGTDPIAEVSLPRSPLVRALAQVRFPRLVAMSQPNIEGTVGFVVERLKNAYPILGEQREAQVTLTFEGASQTQGAKLWQMRSPDEAWQVTLGETFVSLETKEYSSRADFIEHLMYVLAAVADTIAPPFADRLGVRYTNRIEDPALLLRLGDLVRSEMLGGLAVPRPEGVALAHTMSESLYQIGVTNLLARWGLLPLGTTLDPALPPSATSSWVLDVDSFTPVRSKFDAAELASTAADLASSAYRYFRWVVTEEFLREFGGDV